MNSETSFARPGRESPSSEDDVDERGADAGGPRLAAALERLATTARDLPRRLHGEVRSNPYRALAVASGVGFGAGVLVGSRLVRTILVSVGTYAASELLRNLVSDQLRGALDETAPRPN